MDEAGYDLRVAGGVPLAFKFAGQTNFHSLNDPQTSVDSILTSLTSTSNPDYSKAEGWYDWSAGTFTATASDNCAGLGWNKFGIQSWDCFNSADKTRAVVCEYSAEVVDIASIALHYRQDRRCGPNFVAPNRLPAECANVADSGWCCSSAGWCGSSEEHCNCLGCTDSSAISNSVHERAVGVLAGGSGAPAHLPHVASGGSPFQPGGDGYIVVSDSEGSQWSTYSNNQSRAIELAVGVTSVTVQAWGGGGGGAFSSGGGGGFAEGTFAVYSERTIIVVPGGGGGAASVTGSGGAPGFNGGGAGGSALLAPTV